MIDTFDEQEIAIQLLWREVLTEDGYDWLSWYLYEKDGISGKPRKHLQAWDENKIEICQNLKALWKYLIKGEHFKTK